MRGEYEKVRDPYLKGEAKKLRITLARRGPTASRSIGRDTSHRAKRARRRRMLDFPLAELVDCIDWSPFFQTWELAGRYPAIFKDAKVGVEAKKLFADAQAMLRRMVAEHWITANAVIGFWPANAVGDDIEVYGGATGSGGSRRCTRCASRSRAMPATSGRTRRLPISSRPGRQGVATISARSR